MDIPFSIGASMACVAVIALSWLLARTLAKASSSARTMATVTCAVIIGLVALSVGVARAYPGPAWKYAAGTPLHWVHLHVLGLGSYLALLIAFCAAALAATLRAKGGGHTAIVAAGLSALLIVPSLFIGLAVVCNHAGACL